MREIIEHAAAEISLDLTPDVRRVVNVAPADPATLVPRNGCTTSYPRDLIETILRVSGPAALCDEISRDEDPGYMALSIRNVLFAHAPPSDPAGGRILDFGCGCGASTVVLGRTLPGSPILGLDIEERRLAVARARARHWGLRDVSFGVAPGEGLPSDIGSFGRVMLSAVYEHLLPRTRKALLPELWSVVEPGGCLYICETPYRWFPADAHTTLLPLINYLPDDLALLFARRFSPLVSRGQDWEGLLRMGVRGATAGEIMGILRSAGEGEPRLLRPDRGRGRTWTDLWFAGPTLHSYPGGRRVVKLLSSSLERAVGLPFVPFISLAVQKIR